LLLQYPHTNEAAVNDWRSFHRYEVKEAGAGIVIVGLPNVPGQVSPLAFGIRACSAGEMPKVPKAWGLTAPAR